MATPTYTELANALNVASFLDRCTIAVVKFARFILAEATNVTNHQRRNSWAINAIQSPASIINSIKWNIITDPAFTSQDPLNVSTTSDSVLQSAVETTINATLLTF
jgi:hypothetical protein